MSRLDVAIVSASFPPRVCGIADYVGRFAEALRSRGLSAEVFTGAAEARHQPGIVNPVARGWGILGVISLVRALKRRKPAVVHLQWERSIYEQNPAVALLLPFLLRLCGLPIVTTFHSLDGPISWGKSHRAALIPLLWGSRDIVVCSERQLAAVRKLPGLRDRATLIPIGNVIPVVCERPAERAAGPLRLVYFGFVWRGRNIEVVLRSLKSILDVDSGTTLDIVGGIKNEDYRVELARMAVDLGVTEHVRFRGAVPTDEISRLLAKADIALLPFETGVSTGRTTLMAALAHGVPIVTIGVPNNLSELFVDCVNMEIVEHGDDLEFVRRAADLARDAARRDRLSKGAELLSKSLSWDKIAQLTVDLAAYRIAGLSGKSASTVKLDG